MSDGDRADRSVPNTIPLVAFDENDEPFIVRSHLIRPSPLPYWVAVLVVIMMALSLGYIVYSEGQRDKDIDCELDRDRALAVQVTEYQDIQDADRERLQQVIQDLLKAKEPTESRRILEEFLADEETFDTLAAKSRRDIQRALEVNCGRG